MKDYTSKPQKKVSRTNINEHKDSQTGTQVAMKLSRPSAKRNNNRITVQPKLELTQPGDQYEQEADRMADFIMRKQFDNAAMPSTTSVLPPVISRNTDTGSGVAIDTATEHGINASSGGGRALPDNLRSQMESGFGTDFSKVRLHTDSQAAQLSQNINAKAFTYGNDIYFNKGQYNPNSLEGKRLIAHELTHAVQQNGKVGREPQKKQTSQDSEDTTLGDVLGLISSVVDIMDTYEAFSIAKDLTGTFKETIEKFGKSLETKIPKSALRMTPERFIGVATQSFNILLWGGAMYCACKDVIKCHKDAPYFLPYYIFRFLSTFASCPLIKLPPHVTVLITTFNASSAVGDFVNWGVEQTTGKALGTHMHELINGDHTKFTKDDVKKSPNFFVARLLGEVSYEKKRNNETFENVEKFKKFAQKYVEELKKGGGSWGLFSNDKADEFLNDAFENKTLTIDGNQLKENDIELLKIAFEKLGLY